MSDPAAPVLPDEEIAQFARGNAASVPYLMTAFARACGRPAADAGAFAGRVFAPGFEAVRGQGAHALARLIALNVASCGGEITSLTGDERHAEVRAAGLFGEDDLAFYGVSRDDADTYVGTFVPIAEHLGLRAAWRREDEEIVVTVDQPG